VTKHAVFFSHGGTPYRLWRLPVEFREKLIRLPETGMGYQKVTITMEDGRILRNMTVMNCEDVLVPDFFVDGKVKDVQMP